MDYIRTTPAGQDLYHLLPYESTQAPLYYVLTGWIARILQLGSQQILYLGRIISVVFGAGTVYFTWAAAGQISPQKPLWAATAGGMVALLPQFCFNSATAANDSLLVCICAAFFYVCFRGLREPAFDPWLIKAGILVGLAILAKLTGLVLVPVLVVLAITRALSKENTGEGGSVEVSGTDARIAILADTARLAAGGLFTVLVLTGWWWFRNWRVYGEPTGFADSTRLYRARFIPLDFNYLHNWLVATWYSTIGYFGWMEIGLPAAVYTAMFLLATILAALSFLQWWKVVKAANPPPAFQRYSVWVMVVAALLVGASYLQFSVSIAFQPQGRYLFPILVPAALFITWGLCSDLLKERTRLLLIVLVLLGLGIANAGSLAVVSTVGG